MPSKPSHIANLLGVQTWQCLALLLRGKSLEQSLEHSSQVMCKYTQQGVSKVEQGQAGVSRVSRVSSSEQG